MQLIEKYNYQPLVRNTPIGGIRHYICPHTGKKLPSVTAVLDYTSDKSGLLEWRHRIGDKKADEISRESLALGTLVHTHLEHFIAGIPRPTGTNLIRQQAELMADQIIKHGLINVSECWGSEVSLFCPGLYAGTADLVGTSGPSGLSNGTIPTIFDFKSARKMKKREHIENYLTQICAYGLAHDEIYQTQITQGVIFMVDRDLQFQQFVLEGAEFRKYQDKWIECLEKYYEILEPSYGMV